MVPCGELRAPFRSEAEVTIYHFTCACGRELRVDAPSSFMANLAILEAHWVVEPPTCVKCKELPHDDARGTREESDRQVPEVD